MQKNNPKDITKEHIKRLFKSVQPFEYEYFLSGIDCEGISIRWSESGGKRPDRILAISHYENGVLSGEYLRYHYNGTLWCQWNYKNSYRDGIQKDFHENGTLTKLYWYKDGKQDGECQEWWETGNRCKHYWCKDGKRHGEFWYWDEDGKHVFEHSIYKGGELDSELRKNSKYNRDLIHW
jgi:antitoxin component YwqK of YwqJK toxin-antitoxin module